MINEMNARKILEKRLKHRENEWVIDNQHFFISKEFDTLMDKQGKPIIHRFYVSFINRDYLTTIFIADISTTSGELIRLKQIDKMGSFPTDLF